MNELAPFDIREWHAQVGKLLEKQIFFVGGAEKSGTSWLQRLLHEHPQVACGGEAHFLESLFPAIKQALETHNAVVLDPKENPLRDALGEATHPISGTAELLYVLSSSIATFLLKYSQNKPALAVGERSPKNVHSFSILASLFPGTKCIQIVRDPRDAGVSRWFHARRTVAPGERGRMVSISEFVRQNTDEWNEIVGRGVRYGERHPGGYWELRYEDLVERTAPVLSEVFRFLGVDDSLVLAEDCAARASFAALTGGRRRGTADPESFFRKGVAGDWTNHIDAETVDYVTTKAGALMRRFGYV